MRITQEVRDCARLPSGAPTRRRSVTGTSRRRLRAAHIAGEAELKKKAVAKIGASASDKIHYNVGITTEDREGGEGQAGT